VIAATLKAKEDGLIEAKQRISDLNLMLTSEREQKDAICAMLEEIQSRNIELENLITERDELLDAKIKELETLSTQQQQQQQTPVAKGEVSTILYDIKKSPSPIRSLTTSASSDGGGYSPSNQRLGLTSSGLKPFAIGATSVALKSIKSGSALVGLIQVDQGTQTAPIEAKPDDEKVRIYRVLQISNNDK